jgi:hypothetical protein
MHTEIDVRSDTGQIKKNNNNNNNSIISKLIYYLNGGAGEDDDEELTFDVVGFEETAGVIG